MNPLIAVIVPTTGVRSLAATLASVTQDGNEAVIPIVVADGAVAVSSEMVGTLMIALADGPHHDWGGAARNAGIEFARTKGATHVAYLDDDDAYVPGAPEKLVAWAVEDPSAMHIGRMARALDGWARWVDQSIRWGNIGTPMMLVPIEAAAAAGWQSVYDCDWRHALAASDHVSRVVWHEDLLAVVDPWGSQKVSPVAPSGWGSIALATRLTHPDGGFFNCWSELLTRGLRDGDVVMPAPVDRATHGAFNLLASQFLYEPRYAACDTLALIDQDQTFSARDLEYLRRDPRGAEYDLLTALYNARSNGQPLVLQLAKGSSWVADEILFDPVLGWERGDIVPVDLAPFGFTLIRRKALTVMNEHIGGSGEFAWYPRPGSDECVGFCSTLAACGLRAGVHTGVPIGHVVRAVLVPWPDVDVVEV